MSRYILHIAIFIIYIVGAPKLHAQDSLNVENNFNVQETVSSLDSKPDSITNVYQSKLDSLQQVAEELLNHPNDSIASLQQKHFGKVNHYIDSLSTELSELKSYKDLPEEKVKALESKIQSGIDSLTGRLFETINTDKAGKLEEFTNLDVQEKLDVPEMDQLGIDQTMKNLKLDQLQGQGNPMNTINEQVDEQLGKINEVTDINSHMEKAQLPGEVNQALEVVENPSEIDKQIEKYAKEIEELKALEEHGAQVAEIEQMPEEELAKLKEMENMEKLKQDAKLRAVQSARQMFQGQEEKVMSALQEVSKLKKKYAVMPDSKDLSTAKKHSSLKDEPLKKRIVFAINFQLQRGDPLSLDLAPVLMYKFNRNLSAGISGTYRAKLGIDDSYTNAVTESVFGFSGLAQQKIYKGFFGHLELQYMSVPVKDIKTVSDAIPKEWTEGLLLGLGRDMKLSNMFTGQLILCYDFLHCDQSPNAKAWSIKLGIKFGKIKLKDFNF